MKRDIARVAFERAFLPSEVESPDWVNDADIDNDGDPDLYLTNVCIGNLLFENDGKGWAKVALVGSKSNRSGIGATVRVIAGNDIYTKVQDGKSGYLSQSLYPLYFRLGSHTKVDRVEVTWPSGEFQTVDDIELNRLISISESM